MKNIFKQAALALIIAMGLASCSKDDVNNNVEASEEGVANVQLTLNTGVAPASRAAGTATETAAASEVVLATDIFVAVFNEEGELESAQELSFATGQTTEKFTVKTGEKYFYVISDPADVLGLTVAGTPTDIDDFEMQVITAAAANAKGAALETANATSSNFVNATLWRKASTVQSSTTSLEMDLGRMVGKIHVNAIDPSATGFTTMKGTFTQPQYRVGGIALDNYLIGRYEGLIAPPAAGHGKVFSASYEYAQNNGTTGTQNPKFVTQTAFTDGTAGTFYVNENTTQTSTGLYYGNTTHIQLLIKYTPHADEVVDPLTMTKHTTWTMTDGYWAGYVGGKLYIFGSDPRGLSVLDEDASNNELYKGYYKNGINAYRFAIRDRGESTIEKQCRVLRNHYYDVTVASIKHLGETITDGGTGTDPTDPTPVDPEEPIEEEVDLELVIKVLNWSKVAQSEDL